MSLGRSFALYLIMGLVSAFFLTPVIGLMSALVIGYSIALVDKPEPFTVLASLNGFCSGFGIGSYWWSPEHYRGFTVAAAVAMVVGFTFGMQRMLTAKSRW